MGYLNASDSGGCFLISTRCFNHSLALIEVTDKLVFLVDIGIVAVLLVAVVKVDSTRVAFDIVALTLEVVNLVTGLVEV